MTKHPSRLLVVESPTGDLFLVDWFIHGVPEGFKKVTHVLPTPEKYWNLPVYQGT